ncbi:MAG: hypothetical protein JSW67_02195 [Candidatus Latescibacterota bacterium]|nr:MAG: hypothetical protein JSW67_02195 [Candidatus Latescibacterota bacterium]
MEAQEQRVMSEPQSGSGSNQSPKKKETVSSKAKYGLMVGGGVGAAVGVAVGLGVGVAVGSGVGMMLSIVLARRRR